MIFESIAVCGVGDRLLLTTPNALPAERAQELEAQLRQMLGPDVNFVLLAGAQATVIKGPALQDTPALISKGPARKAPARKAAPKKAPAKPVEAL